MSPLPITPSQTAAARPADSPSGSTSSDTDFGPILQAASAVPAGAPARNPSERATGDRAGGAQRQDDGPVSGPNQDPAQRDGKLVARRAARDSTSPQPDANAAAAAAAGARTLSDAATTPSAGTACASSDAARANSPAIATSAVAASDRSADATPLVQDAGKLAAGSALRPLPTQFDSQQAAEAQPAGLAASALDLARLAAVQTPRTLVQAGEAASGTAADLAGVARLTSIESPRTPVQAGEAASGTAADLASFDRLISGETARAPVQAGEAATGAAPDLAGSSADAGSGFSATAQGSAFLASQGVLAVEQALANLVRQGSSNPADSTSNNSTSPRAGTAPSAISPADPSSTPGLATGAAFAPTTSYASEARASVATEVGQPGFGQELSERVLMLTRGGIQTAQISLEPAGLGPVGVSIQVHGHAATLAFTAAHETTRDALEAALPRLRDMFASSGMQLSDATVGGQAQPDGWRSANPPTAGWQRTESDPDTAANPAAEPAATAHPAPVRLVDIYA